jgi:RsiW-degrading membrane proteinase PrsW (M82 family)
LIPRIVLTVLSISLMQEVLKLAMVRYVVLGTDEFDRHPDGIVYGLATGVGFATVLTVEYILRVGGVVPQAGAIIAVQNALLHGALGAVTGYYMIA